MAEGNKFALCRLGEDNYHTWQQRTELWLRKENLWSVIAKPTPAAPDSSWLDRDEQARSTIGLLIEDRYLNDIKHESTARGTWYKIQRIHSHNTLGTRFILYRKIFSTKYIPGSNMDKHITDILEWTSKLENAGYKLLDELVCSALLGSLPPEYKTLITTIEGRNAGDITVEYVRAKIIEEHQNQETQQMETNNKALLTQSGNRPYRSRSPPECYYCHKVGHVRRDCRLLKRQGAHSEFTSTPTATNHEQSRTTSLSNTTPKDNKTTIHIADNSYTTSTYKALNTTRTNYIPPSNTWIIDTGAAEHMTSDSSILQEMSEAPPHTQVMTASGELHKATHQGEYSIRVVDDRQEIHQIVLRRVLLVPSLTESLISIPRLDEEGYKVEFHKKRSWIHTKQRQMLLGSLQGNLYIYDPNKLENIDSSHLCGHVWHDRLGHRNMQDINRMMKDSMTEDLEMDDCTNHGTCSSCIMAKMTNSSFPNKSHKRAVAPFQIIYSDLCGPIVPESLGHNSYILTFTDEFSSYSHTYMVKHKHQTTNCVIDYLEKGITQFGYRPLVFFSDGGGEYNNGELTQYLSRQGIRHLNSLPYTPQENGQAERYNRTLMETTRTLLKHSKLPDYLWAELASTATYLLNRVGRQNLKRTPYELWYGQRPHVGHLRTVGSHCHFYNAKPHKGKLEDRAIPGILVGYGESTLFYKIWEPRNSKMHLSKKVIFTQEQCPLETGTTATPQKPNPNSDPDEDIQTDNDEDKTPELQNRRSTRTNRGKSPQILTYDQLGETSTATRDWYNVNTNNET